MTKLKPADLIKYFNELKSGLGSRSPSYDQYTYPEGFTAEGVAKAFDVSKVTALARLRAMEEDGLLVSRKAYVDGRPGKNFVFLLLEDAALRPGSHFDAGRNVGSTSGTRDILLERFEKRFDVHHTVDAVITDFNVIRNISNRPLYEIASQPIMYSIADDDQEMDRLVLLEVNGERPPYSSEGLMYRRRTEMKWSAFDLKGERPDTRYMMTVYYCIPLDEPLQPGERVNLKIALDIKDVFSRIFKVESAGLTVREHTQRARMVLSPMEGHTVRLVKRFGRESAPFGVVIDDILTDSREEQLERTIEKPSYEGDDLVWDIERPVIGYRYTLPFVMVPREGAPMSRRARA